MLDHPNIVAFHGHFWNDNQSALYMVLDYCECGDLYAKIERHKAKKSYFDDSYIWKIFHQICLGVEHLHQNGIVHRDIKTLNIMMTRNGTVAKLADLGVSRQLSHQTMMLDTMYGTPLYLSPELVDNAAYNEKTDIWSLGIVLYELCCLAPPFQGKSLLAVAEAIRGGQMQPFPPHLAGNFQKVIRWILQVVD